MNFNMDWLFQWIPYHKSQLWKWKFGASNVFWKEVSSLWLSKWIRLLLFLIQIFVFRKARCSAADWSYPTEQDTLIKELDQQIKEQNSQIKRLTNQLASTDHFKFGHCRILSVILPRVQMAARVETNISHLNVLEVDRVTGRSLACHLQTRITRKRWIQAVGGKGGFLLFAVLGSWAFWNFGHWEVVRTVKWISEPTSEKSICSVAVSQCHCWFFGWTRNWILQESNLDPTSSITPILKSRMTQWPKNAYKASKKIHSIFFQLYTLDTVLWTRRRQWNSNTASNARAMEFACSLQYSRVKTILKNPNAKYRAVRPYTLSNLAGLPGPVWPKKDIFARILIHKRVSFEFLFWQFLACQNGNTE